MMSTFPSSAPSCASSKDEPSRFGRISNLEFKKQKNTNDRSPTFRADENRAILFPLQQMLIQFPPKAHLEFFQQPNNYIIITGQFREKTPGIQIVKIDFILFIIIF